jgi:hypothetical protein
MNHDPLKYGCTRKGLESTRAICWAAVVALALLAICWLIDG